MSSNDTDRDRLVCALNDAWHEFAQKVKEFDLRYAGEAISLRPYGWVVPVASGAAFASASELAGLLNQLGESVERKSQLDVTLYFNPRLPPAAGVQ